MSAQLAKELEDEFALKDKRIREQAERDSEIARIHDQQELDMMIAELDRSNEMVAKHLSEYKQAEAKLSHDEKVELINELLKYQRDLAQIKKYQAHLGKDSRFSKASGSELPQEQQTKEPKELSEEELKKMIEIVPAEEVYIEDL
ncbi:hypothetical protein Tco_0429724 [Tanacetum coccineum]